MAYAEHFKLVENHIVDPKLNSGDLPDGALLFNTLWKDLTPVEFQTERQRETNSDSADSDTLIMYSGVPPYIEASAVPELSLGEFMIKICNWPQEIVDGQEETLSIAKKVTHIALFSFLY